MDLTTLTAIPVIIALVQAVKMTNFIADRFIPLISIVFGIGAGMYISITHPLLGIVPGILYGLSAAGLYRAVKVIGGNA